MRSLLKDIYRRWIEERLKICSPDDIEQSAIVFAPHQDDETLGCGGTILHKTERGVNVKIVFMTDGSTSHRQLIAMDELARLRTIEAIDACQLLGVPESDVQFLNFADGQLQQYIEAATSRVADILVSNPVEQIFVPYSDDRHADHVATNTIVRAALAAAGARATIYEYPIWAWHHWPWVSLTWSDRKIFRSSLKTTFLFALGLRIVLTFDRGVYIGDVLGQKRRALAQHRSQVSQLIPDKSWHTLDQMGHGDWLPCFFQKYELFRRYRA